MSMSMCVCVCDGVECGICEGGEYVRVGSVCDFNVCEAQSHPQTVTWSPNKK